MKTNLKLLLILIAVFALGVAGGHSELQEINPTSRGILDFFQSESHPDSFQ